ncbi:ATP-dependent metallopeptidase FtsH/Yme1/Tma family protein, partial [Helicobacter japonicus]
MFSPNGGDSLTDKILGGSITKEITYNELKELISKGEIASVSIGQTYIKAYSLQTSPRILY